MTAAQLYAYLSDRNAFRAGVADLLARGYAEQRLNLGVGLGVLEYRATDAGRTALT